MLKNSHSTARPDELGRAVCATEQMLNEAISGAFEVI
jgi:hypothetical protein